MNGVHLLRSFVCRFQPTVNKKCMRKRARQKDLLKDFFVKLIRYNNNFYIYKKTVTRSGKRIKNASSNSLFRIVAIGVFSYFIQTFFFLPSFCAMFRVAVCMSRAFSSRYFVVRILFLLFCLAFCYFAMSPSVG